MLNHQYYKKQKIFFVIILLNAFFIRSILVEEMNYAYDYDVYLLPWLDYIKQNGNLKALGTAIPTCNYTPFYTIFLALISYLNIKPYILIKLFSILFDILCLIIVYKIIHKLTNNINKALLGMLVLSLSLSLISISSIWGQCDSIYIFFLLCSIYYIIQEKYLISIVFYGIGFAIKLQSIFIAPFFLWLIVKKKIKFRYVFVGIIPYIIFMLIPVCYGRNIFDLLLIYIRQPMSNGLLTLTYSRINFFFILSLFSQYFSHSILKLIIKGMIVFSGILVCIIFYFMNKKNNLSQIEKIEYMFLFSFAMTASLPALQERYSLIVEILALILICFNSKIKSYSILYLILGQLQYLTTNHPLSLFNSYTDIAFILCAFISLMSIPMFVLTAKKILLKNKKSV